VVHQDARARALAAMEALRGSAAVAE